MNFMFDNMDKFEGGWAILIQVAFKVKQFYMSNNCLKKCFAYESLLKALRKFRVAKN